MNAMRKASPLSVSTLMSRVRILSTTSSMMPAWRSRLVQVEILDDALEPRAAENLLADGLKAILDSRRDRRPARTISGTC